MIIAISVVRHGHPFRWQDYVGIASAIAQRIANIIGGGLTELRTRAAKCVIIRWWI
jgi:hypothetical protein